MVGTGGVRWWMCLGFRVQRERVVTVVVLASVGVVKTCAHRESLKTTGSRPSHMSFRRWLAGKGAGHRPRATGGL